MLNFAFLLLVCKVSGTHVRHPQPKVVVDVLTPSKQTARQYLDWNTATSLRILSNLALISYPTADTALSETLTAF